MADNKRYYFLKLKEDFFKDETILLLEDCKDGFMYSNILLKRYLLSLKHEGQLLLSEDIAYTPAMIATLTHHQSGTIEQALQLFIQLGLVEELTDGSLFMSNIQSMIGTTSSEAERKKKERSKLNIQKLISSGIEGGGGQMSAVTGMRRNRDLLLLFCKLFCKSLRCIEQRKLTVRVFWAIGISCRQAAFYWRG